MPRASHKILNTLLPIRLRTALRRGAIAAIPSMRHLDDQSRLEALAAGGFKPRVIYDIGAAHGGWARMARGIWTDARIVGFEPNSRERAALERTKADIGNFEYRLCFLGPERGEIEYTDQGTQTSALRPDDAGERSPNAKANSGGERTKADVLVVDELIDSGEIPAPNFIKLDVQGYELEVLKGAKKALAGVEAALLEISIIDFLDAGMPLIGDVIAYMRERGFVVYDITNAIRRPSDDALIQIDAIFVPEKSPLRAVDRS